MFVQITVKRSSSRIQLDNLRTGHIHVTTNTSNVCDHNLQLKLYPRFDKYTTPSIMQLINK